MGEVKLGNSSIKKCFLGDKEVKKVYMGDKLVYSSYTYKRKFVSVFGNNIIVFEDDFTYNVYSCPYVTGTISKGIIVNDTIYMHDNNGNIYSSTDFVNWAKINIEFNIANTAASAVIPNGRGQYLIYSGMSSPAIFDTATNTSVALDNKVDGSTCQIMQFFYNPQYKHFFGIKNNVVREYGNDGSTIKTIIRDGNACTVASSGWYVNDSSVVFANSRMYDFENDVEIILPYTNATYGVVKGMDRKLLAVTGTVAGSFITGIVELDNNNNPTLVYKRNQRYVIGSAACKDDVVMDISLYQFSSTILNSLGTTMYFNYSILGDNDNYNRITVPLVNPTKYLFYPILDVMNVRQ